MKNKILYIIIVILSILLWLKGCNTGYSEVEKITVRDTVKTHITQIDTVYFPKEVPVYTNIPVYTPIYDTLGKTWIYNNPVEDSLISGNIRTTIQDCSMLGQSITYIPKFPKYIYRTDSILTTITVTNTLYEKQRNLLIGVTLTGNNSYFEVSPTIGLKTKHGDVISFGYGLFNRNIQLSLYKRIKFK